MSKYRCDGAGCTTGGLGPPGPGIQMLKDQLIHTVVHGVGFKQDLVKFSKQSSSAGHGFTSGRRER
jgi:hypothetical protein